MSGPPANPFDVYYPEVAPALRAWAVLRSRGVLGRFLEADDLVQEVCFQAYRGVAGFDQLPCIINHTCLCNRSCCAQ